MHEFDANQTTALAPIEQDLLMMESWISDMEGLFADGLTDIHFPASQWAALSSRNTLKTELTLHAAAVAGVSVITGYGVQPTTILGTLLAGVDPIRFSYRFINGTGILLGASILALPGMSTSASSIERLSEKSTPEDAELKALYAELAKQPLVNYQNNDYPMDPNTGDYGFTFESMRRVVGGNGPGTPDGGAPMP